MASYRLWTFTARNGNQKLLASIIGDEKYRKLTNSYEFAVEKPATLVLKNVNMSYDGKYKFSLQPTSGVSESEVVVYIAGKFYNNHLNFSFSQSSFPSILACMDILCGTTDIT